MELVANFRFRFGNDTLSQFWHLIDIRKRGARGECVPTSVTLTFPKPGHISGGWGSHIADLDGCAVIIRVPREQQGGAMQRLFTTGQFGWDKMAPYDFVIEYGETKGEECIWVGRGFLLCRFTIPGKADM